MRGTGQEPEDRRPPSPTPITVGWFKHGDQVKVRSIVDEVFKVYGNPAVIDSELVYTLGYKFYHSVGEDDRFLHGVEESQLTLAPRDRAPAKFKADDRVKTPSSHNSRLEVVNVYDGENVDEVTYDVYWYGNNQTPGGSPYNVTRERERNLQLHVEDEKPSLPPSSVIPLSCPKCGRDRPFRPTFHKLGGGESFSRHPCLYKYALPPNLEYLTWKCECCGYDGPDTTCRDATEDREGE